MDALFLPDIGNGKWNIFLNKLVGFDGSLAYVLQSTTWDGLQPRGSCLDHYDSLPFGLASKTGSPY